MNSFGRIFRITIYGESHGVELGVIIDGCPAGFDISDDCFNNDLKRRSARGIGTTSRKESDNPIIKSGVYKNKTTGAPICISFKNENIKSEDYDFNGFCRPGHADFTAKQKFNALNDPRGGGQFSGRLTTALVAAGVIAKKIVNHIEIKAEIDEIGGEKDYHKLLEKTIEKGDSLGGIISCTVKNVPIGLGEPFFNSVESAISALVFSIPGIKAIEFGNGIKSVKMKGSEFNDKIVDKTGLTDTNNAGGINGGITNGNDIYFKVFVKPTSSISKKQKTYNFKTEKVEDLSIKGRHDVCFALRVPPIIEAVTAIALADFYFLNLLNKS